MTNDKRARQRANRMERIHEEERAEARARRNKLIIRWGLIAVGVLGLAFLYSVLSSDDDPAVEATGATATLSPGAEVLGGTAPDCPAEDGSSERQTNFAAPPEICIEPDTLYTAEFVTSEGNFTAVLDPSLDLRSVNNFIVLARYHAYDGTIFHRVIEDFVIQGGDVEDAFGRGSPGYRFTGAFPPEDIPYQIGSIAMANSGDPASNGSQFFVVTGPDGARLPPNYSLLGQVTDGSDIALSINATDTEVRDIDGRPAADVPVVDVVLESVTIREATGDEKDAYEDLIDG